MASSDGDPPKYPDKQLGKREIRLIRLLPGNWTDPIQCELYRKEYDTAEYNALSYVWGSNKVKRSITFAGQPWLVTRNLESALRHLRHRHRNGLTLWVDALCINQGDVAERTHQVGLMDNIYKRCQKVIVYLGDQLGDTELLDKPPPLINLGQQERHSPEMWHELRIGYLESRGDTRSSHGHDLFDVLVLIQELSRNIHLHEISAFKSRDAEEQTRLFEAFERLMDNQDSWWNRVWVIQEVAFTSQVDVTYGSISAPWDMFVQAASSHATHVMECCSRLDIPQDQSKVLGKFDLSIVELNELRSVQDAKINGQMSIDPIVFTRNTSLLGLLQKFRHRKATDPRDKVYALLSLTQKPEGRPPFSPDYSLSEIDAFCRATLECIHESNSLSVFSTELGSSRSSRTDLPTWVPDWTTPRDHNHYVRSEAVNLYNAYPQPESFNISECVKGNKVLSLEGFHFNTVLSVHEVMREDDSKGTLEDWWRTLYFRQGVLDPEQNWELTRSFWKLICAEVIAETAPTSIRRMVQDDELTFALWSLVARGLSPLGHRNFFPNWKQFLEQCPQKPDPEGAHALARIIPMINGSIMQATLSRRLIVSQNYIGLGPATAQRGDALFFLRGGKTPFVLRPLGGRTNMKSWEIVTFKD